MKHILHTFSTKKIVDKKSFSYLKGMYLQYFLLFLDLCFVWGRVTLCLALCLTLCLSVCLQIIVRNKNCPIFAKTSMHLLGKQGGGAGGLCGEKGKIKQCPFSYLQINLQL